MAETKVVQKQSKMAHAKRARKHVQESNLCPDCGGKRDRVQYHDGLKGGVLRWRCIPCQTYER